MVCHVVVPPTPWPPAIRHHTLRMEAANGKWDVRDHDWVIQPRTYALTPQDNIQGRCTVMVHDSYVDEFGRSAVMEFQVATTFPDCSWHAEPPFFYLTALADHGTPSLPEYFFPPYGPEAYLHGNLFWPAHKPLDEGTWGIWIESEVHFRFDLNTDLDWKPLAFIQVYAVHVPRLVTVPAPKVVIEDSDIFDTAVLSGCIHPTGFITFKLFHDGEGQIYGCEVPVDGNGSYRSDPKYHVPFLVGDPHYHWHASYSGDVNNDPLSAEDEPFEVQPTFVHIDVTDMWEPRDSQLQLPRPGIAKFKRQTPEHEEWFIPT